MISSQSLQFLYHSMDQINGVLYFSNKFIFIYIMLEFQMTNEKSSFRTCHPIKTSLTYQAIWVPAPTRDPSPASNPDRGKNLFYGAALQ